MKELEKSYGVVYNNKTIVAIKNPEIEVFPAQGSSIYECDTQDELEAFIAKEGLHEMALGIE